MSLLEELAFVVIGRNEGDRLEACLRSVRPFSERVIYADSLSSDGSVERARSIGAIAVELDTSAPLNAARGRNAGLDAVRAHFPEVRFIQFLDGDCVLAPDWVTIALEFLESRPQAAIACGRRFEAHPHASFYNGLADEEWDTPVGCTQACGGDAMMRVAALNEVGGFNSGLMASEEPELAARLRHRGWEVWRLDVPMTEHDANILTFAQWWKRSTRSGYGYAQAWHSSRDLPERVNSKLLRSSTLWVFAIPLVLVMVAIATGRASALLLYPLMLLVQIFRIALRRPKLSLYGLRVSGMMMLAKVPELIGAGRFALRPGSSAMIEYKSRNGEAVRSKR